MKADQEEKITESEPPDEKNEKVLSKEPREEEKLESPKKKKEFFIKVLWRGDYSLALSYWGFYQLGGSIYLYLLIEGMEVALHSSASTALYFFSALFFIFYLIVSMIGSWKSATKYKKEKLSENKPYGWAIAAYVTIALGGLRIIVTGIDELNLHSYFIISQ